MAIAVDPDLKVEPLPKPKTEQPETYSIDGVYVRGIYTKAVHVEDEHCDQYKIRKSWMVDGRRLFYDETEWVDKSEVVMGIKDVALAREIKSIRDRLEKLEKLVEVQVVVIVIIS